MDSGTLSRAPTAGEVARDIWFRRMTLFFAWFIIFLVGLIVFQIARVAAPAVSEHGLDFLTEKKWDAGSGKFGILPEIWGTLYSSILGVAIGAFFGISVAIFLTQDFLPHKGETFLKNVVELLAAIPSVVYGLWGIFVLIPLLRPPCNWLHENLGWVPIFETRLTSLGMLPASLVLAIMVLPTICAISRDSLASVPPKLREAAFGLGATRWETILAVIVPTASRGIWGSVILAFGRALGETMALAMLAGGVNEISWSMFSPADTLAALLANKFPEAGTTERGALMYAALVLLAITLIVNVFGTLVTERRTAKGVR